MSEENGNIEPEPTGVDALIADLGADGTVDSEGRFTLDREVARKKLQRFQLEDPHRFVLELIRSAVQRGAERIEIWLDTVELSTSPTIETRPGVPVTSTGSRSKIRTSSSGERNGS